MEETEPTIGPEAAEPADEPIAPEVTTAEPVDEDVQVEEAAPASEAVKPAAAGAAVVAEAAEQVLTGSAPTPAEPGHRADEAPEPAAPAVTDLPPVNGFDVPARRTHGWPLFALLAAFVILSCAVVGADFVLLSYVPRGVTVAGKDVANLSESELRAAIEQHVSTPAMQPLTVAGDAKSWQLDPKGIVSVDAEAMVAAAYKPAREASMVDRLWSRIAGASTSTEVKPAYSVDKAALAQWVAQTAATVDREPVDATQTVVKYKIVITPEVVGATVDQTRAVDEIASALTGEASLLPASRIAQLPIATVKPKVVSASFKRAIVVSLKHTKVYYYEGDKLVKTYLCAPGQPAWPTPRGDFHVVRKQANAPWYNPGSSWAASMPKSIPGGPNNPMGDRKIGINSPGIFLHGIPPSEYSSIGTHASHGCMRMMPSSIHDLYPRVRVGDPVYIRD